MAVAAGDAEAQVGLVADDPHFVRLVEALLDPLHLLALGVPVQEHGAPEELLEGAEAHARVLGHRRCGEAARQPRDFEVETALEERVGRLGEELAAVKRQVGAFTGVLGRADVDPRVDALFARNPER